MGKTMTRKERKIDAIEKRIKHLASCRSKTLSIYEKEFIIKEENKMKVLLERVKLIFDYEK